MFGSWHKMADVQTLVRAYTVLSLDLAQRPNKKYHRSAEWLIFDKASQFSICKLHNIKRLTKTNLTSKISKKSGFMDSPALLPDLSPIGLLPL